MDCIFDFKQANHRDGGSEVDGDDGRADGHNRVLIACGCSHDSTATLA